MPAFSDRIAGVAPGVAATCALGALCAASAWYVPGYDVVIALVAGYLAAGLLRREIFAPGVRMSAVALLRLGVVLIGAGVPLQLIAAQGADFASIAIGGLLVSFVVTFLFRRALGLTAPEAAVIAGAVGICGASAAAAIGSIVRNTPSETARIAGVVLWLTLVSTGAMLVLPEIAGALALTDGRAGLFLGGSIHEVVHAVAAAQAISPESADIATLTKMTRVSMLAPVLVIISLLYRGGGPGMSSIANALIFPTGFLAATALGGSQLLPDAFVHGVATGGRILLLAALVAWGSRIDLGQLRRAGLGPLKQIAVPTVALAAAVLGLAAFIAP